jgi:hypothetical protein
MAQWHPVLLTAPRPLRKVRVPQAQWAPRPRGGSSRLSGSEIREVTSPPAAGVSSSFGGGRGLDRTTCPWQAQGLPAVVKCDTWMNLRRYLVVVLRGLFPTATAPGVESDPAPLEADGGSSEQAAQGADPAGGLRALLARHPKLPADLAQHCLDNQACDEAETHLCWAKVLAALRRQQRSNLYAVVTKAGPHRPPWCLCSAAAACLHTFASRLQWPLHISSLRRGFGAPSRREHACDGLRGPTQDWERRFGSSSSHPWPGDASPTIPDGQALAGPFPAGRWPLFC